MNFREKLLQVICEGCMGMWMWMGMCMRRGWDWGVWALGLYGYMAIAT